MVGPFCCCFLWLSISVYYFFFFFFKQKTAYEMRISDWSSDVCSSDLPIRGGRCNPRGTSHPAELCRETALKGIAGLIVGGFSLFSAPTAPSHSRQTHAQPRPGSRPAADLPHHRPPRSGQAHAHRKAAAVRQRHPYGRPGQGTRREAAHP